MNNDKHLEKMEKEQLITVIRNLKSEIYRTKESTSEGQGAEGELNINENEFKTLYQISFNSGLSTNEKIKQALKYGADLLKLDIGLVSKIKNDNYKIQNVYSHTASIEKGTVFDLNKTYCNIPLTQKKLITIENMGESIHSGNPCYKSFEYESYIGIPLKVENDISGTLSFSSHYPRKNNFSQSDKSFMELMAQWVSLEIEKGYANQDEKDSTDELSDRINKKIESLLDENKSLRSKLRKKDSAQKSLKSEIDEKTKVIRSLQKESIETKSARGSYENKMDEKKRVIKSLKEENLENKRFSESYKNEIVKIKKVIKSLEKEILEKKNTAESYKKEIAEIKKVEKSLQREIQDKMNDSESYKKEIVEIKKVKKSLEKVILDKKSAEESHKNKIDRIKKVEASLKEKDQYSQAVINFSPDCIVTIDQSGIIQEFNHSAEKTFGYTKEEISGKNIMNELFPTELEKGADQRFLSYLNKGNNKIINKKFEVSAQKKNGITMKSKLTVSGKVINNNMIFIIYLRDFSDVIQTRMAIKQSVDSLNVVLDSLKKAVI